MQIQPAFICVLQLILGTSAFARPAQQGLIETAGNTLAAQLKSFGSAKIAEAQAANRAADKDAQRKIIQSKSARQAAAKKAEGRETLIDEPSELRKRAIELYKAGRYSEAIPLAQRSLAFREKALGPDHPNVAASLELLATLYEAQGYYADAEPLYKRSLAIFERSLGPDHQAVAGSLNNLAELYREQGRYTDAEPLYRRSLEINEKTLGPNHPEVASSLNNMGLLYLAQGRYADAAPLFKRSLATREKTLGPVHPDVAQSLNNLGLLYRAQGRYAEAEPLFTRSLEINEKSLGPNHPEVAGSLNNLAALYEDQGRYADAEPLFTRSLEINEKSLGPNHPEVAGALNNLAALYEDQGRYADAEPLFTRSLEINEKSLGPNHPEVAGALNNLAALYEYQGRYADAEPLLKRSLAINEKAFGPNHPEVARSLNNLGALYQDQGRYSAAEPLYERALAINEGKWGSNHPEVAKTLERLAVLYDDQGRYADAEPIYKRSLAALENALGPDNTEVASLLNNIAANLQSQGRYAEAEPLLKRCLVIKEKVLGPDHPAVGRTMENLANLLDKQGRYGDTEPLYKRSLAIFEKALGPYHPEVALALNNLAEHYRNVDRFGDALPIVQRTIVQNHVRKSVALSVMYGSQSENLISPTEALNASYTVFQRSASSAAGEAVSKLAGRFAAGTSELARLVRKDQDLTAEADRLDKSIIAAVSKPPAERNASMEDQIRKRIDEIKSERENLQNILNQRFPDYVALSKPPPLTIEQTQALLAHDEALVIMDLDKSSYAWVITKDRAEWRQLSVSSDDVAKEVATLRAALDPNSLKPFDTDLAYQLYEQILAMSDVISNKTQLSFVLSGALTSLPPQVLITTDPKGKDLATVDWLIRKYAVTILPSVASLKVLRGEKVAIAAIKPMIGFGDPVFHRATQIAEKKKGAALNRSLTSFYRGATADMKALAEALPALPETADELRAVAKDLGAKPEDIKLEEAASVTQVKHAPLQNYRIVYFATHALVAGEVETFSKVKAEPALILSIPETPSEEDDGLLRASDVATLKMNADFVVLSACNTAAGDKPGAEALSGLARAFFYAGARSLIVSNWEVDSEATVALMTGLFDALKTNPRLSHAEALRLSMLKMIDKPSKAEWVQPKYWAPFVVVGEPQKN